MINNIYYPVEFIVQQEHRYALWVEGDGGDGFLKDVDSGSVVYAKTKFKLYEMSEREKLNARITKLENGYQNQNLPIGVRLKVIDD